MAMYMFCSGNRCFDASQDDMVLAPTVEAFTSRLKSHHLAFCKNKYELFLRRNFIICTLDSFLHVLLLSYLLLIF